MLRPYGLDAAWPRVAESLARDTLWTRAPVTVLEPLWGDCLFVTLRIRAPQWSWVTERPCATHGDLTLCNTMRNHAGGVVFIDPVFPERVPSIRQTDQARILQSMLGWEIMTGHQDRVIEWETPDFVYCGLVKMRVLLFWTSVVMARLVASTDVTEHERAWATHLRSEIEGVLP